MKKAELEALKDKAKGAMQDYIFILEDSDPTRLFKATDITLGGEDFELLERLDKRVESFYKTMNPALEALKKIQKTLSAEKYPRRSNSETLRNVKVLSERLSVYPDSEAYNLVLERYSELSNMGVEHPVKALTEEMTKKIESASFQNFGLDFYLNVFLALLMFIFSQKSSRNLERDLNELKSIVAETNATLKRLEHDGKL